MALRARSRAPNAYLKFQECGNRGLVEFYLNGLADSAIEELLNETQTVDQASGRQSQAIDDHADGFLNGNYPWKRYVLFNFAMKGDGLVLPRNQAMWNKTCTFVSELNCLFRGRTIMKENVTPRLTGGTRPPISAVSVVRSSSQPDTETDPYFLRLRCGGDASTLDSPRSYAATAQ